MQPGRLGDLGQGEAIGLRAFKALAPLICGSVELALFPFVARLSALGIIARFALGGVGHWETSLVGAREIGGVERSLILAT
jgi:hypothetical protein